MASISRPYDELDPSGSKRIYERSVGHVLLDWHDDRLNHKRNTLGKFQHVPPVLYIRCDGVALRFAISLSKGKQPEGIALIRFFPPQLILEHRCGVFSGLTQHPS